MTKKLLILLLPIFLSACATGNYQSYTEASLANSKVSSNAHVAKLEALTAIANSPSATDSNKASALMAIAMISMPVVKELKAPKDPLDLVETLAPLGLQGYLGWLNFFTKQTDMTRGAADSSVIKWGNDIVAP